DEYAISRPSGEKAGSASLNGVLRKTVGWPGFQPEASSPCIGRIITSPFPGREFSSVNAGDLPLGCHELGCWLFALSVKRCGSPVPSARCQYRLLVTLSARRDPNTIRVPSGVHRGERSSARSKVSRDSVAR